MTRTCFYYFTLLCALLCIEAAAGYFQTAAAQPVRIAVSQDSLRAGQVFDLYIVFEGSQEFDSVHFPDSTAFEEPFELITAQTTLNSQQADSTHYRLQFFGSEDSLLEDLYALGIRHPDTLVYELPDVQITFISTLAEDESLRPLKPIFDFAASLLPWIIGFMVLMLLMAGGYYSYKRYRENQANSQAAPLPPAPPPPFRNPFTQLQEQIELLRLQLESGTANPDHFYVQLSDAMRSYFERVYGFPALEQTSREVMQSLGRRPGFDEELETIRQLLGSCDIVKFARSTPDEEQMSQDLSTLNTIAQKLKARDMELIKQLRIEHLRRYEPAEPETGATS